MRPYPTGQGHASAATSRATAGAQRSPGPQGTAPRPRGGTRVRSHGGAHPGPTPHGKAHSAAPASRRVRLSVTSPPGRRGTKPPANLRGTMENGPTGQMRSSDPPPSCGGVAPGPAGLSLGPGRTERRGLCFGSIRTAQSRYGSRTGSYAQFIYMMWWQSARVTQRRECRRPAADSGRGAWLRPKPRPRKRVAAAMAPLAQ